VSARPSEAIGSLEAIDSSERRRALVIINPYATTVSDRLRNLVVSALASRYDVEAVETRARGHATETGRARRRRRLRRGRRVRRRRYGQRDRKRARRIAHATDTAAGRLGERLLQAARNPLGDRRRDRAPARARRSLAAPRGRPRVRRRPSLHVQRRGRDRRERRAPGRRPPGPQAPLRPELLPRERALDVPRHYLGRVPRLRVSGRAARSRGSPRSFRTPSTTRTSTTARSTWPSARR
jgi:hypothetical protein